jgi:hypothetical protein
MIVIKSWMTGVTAGIQGAPMQLVGRTMMSCACLVLRRVLLMEWMMDLCMLQCSELPLGWSGTSCDASYTYMTQRPRRLGKWWWGHGEE